MRPNTRLGALCIWFHRIFFNLKDGAASIAKHGLPLGSPRAAFHSNRRNQFHHHLRGCWVSTTNYPIQIGRPFVQREITSGNCPQAVVGGTAVTTQANVTQSWTDGSVRHAIIAFLIPTLTANSSVTVTFQSQSSCNTTALTLAQMQNPAYNFDAKAQFTNGSTVTADALTMLNAGAYSVWTPGSVAQTVLIADDGQETRAMATPAPTTTSGSTRIRSSGPGSTRPSGRLSTRFPSAMSRKSRTAKE